MLNVLYSLVEKSNINKQASWVGGGEGSLKFSEENLPICSCLGIEFCGRGTVGGNRSSLTSGMARARARKTAEAMQYNSANDVMLDFCCLSCDLGNGPDVPKLSGLNIH